MKFYCKFIILIVKLEFSLKYSDSQNLIFINQLFIETLRDDIFQHKKIT
jgi:hypothetical protein